MAKWIEVSLVGPLVWVKGLMCYIYHGRFNTIIVLYLSDKNMHLLWYFFLLLCPPCTVSYSVYIGLTHVHQMKNSCYYRS